MPLAENYCSIHVRGSGVFLNTTIQPLNVLRVSIEFILVS